MKKKIIHIITKLELGGAQENTIYTVRNLNKEIFDTILVFGPGGILDEEVLKDNRIKKIVCKNLLRQISPLNDIIAFFNIIQILKKEKPDIIHSHSSKAGILARLAGIFFPKIKKIHTYHGFGFNKNQNFIVRYFYIFLERFTAIFTDFFIFVSKANMSEAESLNIGNKKRYILLRSGIKLALYKEIKKDYRELEKFTDKKADKMIVSLGNFKPQKNPDDFYEVAKKVLSQKDVLFIYIGGGERLGEFREKAKKDGISEKCIFTDWLKEPYKILALCDIFILTSLWEGLPRSLVEAMSCGLAPICYKTDGVCDIINNGVNGYLIEQGDKQGMAEKIKFLIENENEYLKIKDNVSKTDLAEFDIDNMVRRQEELYLKISFIKI